RSFATRIVAEYAADKPELLADLMMDGDAKQFPVLIAKLQTTGDRGRALLIAELDKLLYAKPGAPVLDADKEKQARRQAVAAAALLHLGPITKVWETLKHRPDPRARTYLIHGLAPMQADPQMLLKRLDEEPDVSVRRALLLSLGEFTAD